MVFCSAVHSYASRPAQRNGPHRTQAPNTCICLSYSTLRYCVTPVTLHRTVLSTVLYYCTPYSSSDYDYLSAAQLHPLLSYSSNYSRPLVGPPGHHFLLFFLLFVPNRNPRAGSFFWRARFALFVSSLRSPWSGPGPVPACRPLSSPHPSPFVDQVTRFSVSLPPDIHCWPWSSFKSRSRLLRIISAST